MVLLSVDRGLMRDLFQIARIGLFQRLRTPDRRDRHVPELARALQPVARAGPGGGLDDDDGGNVATARRRDLILQINRRTGC